jgi:hypothetical protein
VLRQALPALLFLALLRATQPALAQGLVPVCTAAGTVWAPRDGAPAKSPPDQQACPHGWCAPRKPRPARTP